MGWAPSQPDRGKHLENGRIKDNSAQKFGNKKQFLGKADLRLKGNGTSEIAFQPTAMGFITAAPAGKLKRSETILLVGNEENLELAVGTVNTHAAYAWWQAYSDSFHINPHEIATIAVPETWVTEKETNRQVRALARKLIVAINPANVRSKTSGTKSTKRDSLNFHKCASETIAKLDELYLAAMGMSQQPLLDQLRTLRSDSNWKLGIKQPELNEGVK